MFEGACVGLLGVDSHLSTLTAGTKCRLQNTLLCLRHWRPCHGLTVKPSISYLVGLMDCDSKQESMRSWNRRGCPNMMMRARVEMHEKMRRGNAPAACTKCCHRGILVRLVMHLFWGEKYKDLWFYTLFYIFILYLYSS